MEKIEVISASEIFPYEWEEEIIEWGKCDCECGCKSAAPGGQCSRCHYSHR